MESTPNGEGTPGGRPDCYSSAALIQKGKEKEKELLDRLKEFFVEKGQPLEEGWRVEVKIRTTGTSLGTTDAYYFSPSNKRYRSRMEIARDLGVVDEKERKAGSSGGGKGRNRKADGGGAAPPQLSREAAITEARRRREEFKLPRVLACGVTVTSLGNLHPGNHAFCNSERLWPAGYAAEWEDEKGVRFISSITETPSGPMFRIKAQRLAHEGRPATEVMELGAGPTPDDAYRDAEERQAEALEIALLNRSIKNRGGAARTNRDDPDASPVVPAGRALDAAEHLLVKCRPLGVQWGLERFGLADPSVLQAIEGLPGAERCPGYVFVDERPGGWVAKARKLNVELVAHGKKQVPVDARRMSGEGPGSVLRKRPPRPSRKEAEENAVRRVLDGVIKSIEMEEMKHYTAEQKLRMKLDKQLDRDRKKVDRDKMSDAMHKMREQQRLQQKAAYIEAQRRQAELNATVEDTELPNANEAPPTPSPVAGGRMPLHQQAVLLEAWQFVSRFGVPLLHLAEDERLPMLEQLEAALLGEATPTPPPPPLRQQPLLQTTGGSAEAIDTEQEQGPRPPDAAVQLQMVLVDFLVGGLFQDTAQAILGDNSDITMADLRGPGKHVLHPLPIQQETWQEAARRYLTVLATSAMTQAKDGGMPGASSPLAVMDPWVILQYLTAGPPSTLTQGAAVLPRGASKTAGHSLIARADAMAVAAAGQAFLGWVGGGRSAEELRQEQELLRCVLKDIIQSSKMKKGDGRVLCYGGQVAAAAAKFGRPLDFRCIAARIDAGVYSALPQPMAAFAADVKYVASLYQAGCNKSSSLFAQEYVDKSAPELAALAVSKLEQALREIEVTGGADYVAQHAPRLPRRTPESTPTLPAAAAAGTGGSGGEGIPSAAIPTLHEASAELSSVAPASEDRQRSQLGLRQATDAVRDLDRPFAPFKEHGSWRGCVMCWTDDDPLRLLPCDACDCQLHSYCLEPPLEEPPLQTEPFLCPRCIKLHGPGAASGGKPLLVEFARASGGEAAWCMAQLLAAKDYSEWSVGERCALLHMLCTLCAESAQVHDTLHGEEDEVKDKRKEIAQLRQEVKRLQAEMAAAQQQQLQRAADGGSADAPQSPVPALALQAQRQSRRAGRNPAAEIESMVQRISKLEHDITQVGPVRLEPVGMDRHYNRYWLLPAAATVPDGLLVLPDAPPVLVVERHSLDSLRPVGVEAAAAVLEQCAGTNGGGKGGGVDTMSGGAAMGDGWQVGLYNSILHLQQLAQWLNPKGTREKPLASEVTHLLDQHQQFAMQHVQPPRPPAEELPPLDPAAVRTAAVARLQQALLSFEEGNQSGTYADLTGSEPRRQHWRTVVAAAHTPQALAAALLVLEGMVRPEYLKPHWRPFSIPAPLPTDISTLPAVWLRLEALKTSVKLKLTLNMRSLKDVMGGTLVAGAGGTRYSLREPKPLVKRSYNEGPEPASRTHSDGEDETHETRAERAAKRAKQRERPGMQEQPDDEAVGQELDAELNLGARRTRHRTTPAYGHYGQGFGGGEAEWEEEDDSQEEDDPDDVDVEMDDLGSED